MFLVLWIHWTSWISEIISFIKFEILDHVFFKCLSLFPSPSEIRIINIWGHLEFPFSSWMSFITFHSVLFWTYVLNIGKDWCWEGLGAGGKGDIRGWDGWMASPTRCTWVWVNSRCWWWTGTPGVLQFMESQRVGHDWVTELNWTDVLNFTNLFLWNS